MKFLCNGMLGRLCRYLRLCGIDTQYSNEGLKTVLIAKKEDRIVLTRNTHLKDREGVFYIETEDLPTQLKTVIEKFELINQLNPFSRCLCCNELLVSVEKEKVKDRIPFYTYKNFNEFAECPKCGRVYWKGSHYKNMVNKIKKLMY
ncbi:MAG: Mut7-C RNAse domain-containing protein [bacterium]